MSRVGSQDVCTLPFLRRRASLTLTQQNGCFTFLLTLTIGHTFKLGALILGRKMTNDMPLKWRSLGQENSVFGRENDDPLNMSTPKAPELQIMLLYVAKRTLKV